MEILEYNRAAEDRFRHFRQQGIRIGTQDLRIASISIANSGIIVTRNLKDFGQVPGLAIEDWSV
ncbi:MULTISPECIES: type II toxin-antitoxin system VapC family toxin [unclassified Chamaesiphon]|uniref:type II toxin-antitoxin system VapC family toxin n=1 Tax=unclassified Chamaesiphon TaxID=2620921 RepID=UPI00286A98EC|nr:MULTISPECIES: type II toxin-antitoxin system VapC family toxin [unclassified Chamaesiphon]